MRQTFNPCPFLLLAASMLTMAILGCRPAPPEPAGLVDSPSPGASETETLESSVPAVAIDEQAGTEPLVDNPKTLRRLHPEMPVWMTADRKSVVVMSAVCARNVPLEMFACLRGSKEHESVLVIDSKAHVIHAGLLAAGASPGSPVRFYPQYSPASGQEIEVTLVWKDEQGEVRRARGQDWVRDERTGEAMRHHWVFGGSRFETDEETGEQFYRADYSGDLICVSNFADAVMDVPVKSTDSASGLLFEAFTEQIPELGTPVTMILTPKM